MEKLEEKIAKDLEFAKTLGIVLAFLAVGPLKPGSIYRRLVNSEMPTDFDGYESVDELLRVGTKEGYFSEMEDGSYRIEKRGHVLSQNVSSELANSMKE